MSRAKMTPEIMPVFFLLLSSFHYFIYLLISIIERGHEKNTIFFEILENIQQNLENIQKNIEVFAKKRKNELRL